MLLFMRKLIVGLSLLLTISLFPAYSANPVKAGSPCSKQGITKVYKGKTFKCIKSKNKLVWNKGKIVDKPTLSPTPTTVTATPSPTSQAFTLIVNYKRFNDDYQDWNLWVWKDKEGFSEDLPISNQGISFSLKSDFGAKLEVTISDLGNYEKLGFIVRKGDWQDRDILIDRFYVVKKSEAQRELWLLQNDSRIYLSRAEIPNVQVRTLRDRSDECSGLLVKPVYVIPSDGIDLQKDVVGNIQEYLQEGNQYFQEQIGRQLSIDCFESKPDVLFLRSKFSARDLSLSQGGDLRLISELNREFKSSWDSQFIYIFFIEASGIVLEACGYARSPGNVVVAAVGEDCGANRPNYQFKMGATLTWTHEIIHSIGVWHIEDKGFSDGCDLMSGRPLEPALCGSLGRQMDPRRNKYVDSSSMGVDILNWPGWKKN